LEGVNDARHAGRLFGAFIDAKGRNLDLTAELVQEHLDPKTELNRSKDDDSRRTSVKGTA